MKKILITLMIALISNTSNTNHTFEDLQATPHKKEELCTTFLDAAKLFEECEDTNNSLQYLEEYDHNITDNVTPASDRWCRSTV